MGITFRQAIVLVCGSKALPETVMVGVQERKEEVELLVLGLLVERMVATSILREPVSITVQNLVKEVGESQSLRSCQSFY